MKTWQRFTRRDERGVDMVAAIFVIPMMIVLVLGLLDIGMMFRSRSLVENVARDAVRNVAADGGNLNTALRPGGQAWDQWALGQMYASGECQLGLCIEGAVPTADCRYVTPAGNLPPNKANTSGQNSYVSGRVNYAGETVTCHITYPYKAINQGLLDTPFGLEIGRLIKPFDYWVSARAETGCKSQFSNVSTC